MAKRPEAPRRDDTWLRVPTMEVGGKIISAGDAIKVKGEPGSFVFKNHVTNPRNGAMWVDCQDEGRFRAFDPSRVTKAGRK